MKIFLIGLPGVGKTYIGKLLATDLKLSFIDLDKQIEQKSKLSISEIFDKLGEEQFRLLEASELLKIINNNENFVLAVGGGAPCFYNGIDKIKSSGLVVWLQSQMRIIVQNIIKDGTIKRPLFNKQSSISNHLAELLKKRIGVYRQAHIIFSVDSGTVSDLSKTITDQYII